MQKIWFPFLKPGLTRLLSSLLLMPLAAWQGQGPPPVVLRAEGALFTPRQFYISQVADERKERKTIAYLVLPTGSATPQPVDLQGGGQAAITSFIRQSVPANKSLRPVVLRLQQCLVTEKLLANGQVEGQLSLALVFEVQDQQGKTLVSLPYKSGARYQRQRQVPAPLAASLGQSLAGGLRYFNAWMDREAGRSERLATRLRVTFRDYTVNEDPDTLFYHPTRPLRWEDFRAQPRPGPYAAAVFPSFSYEGHTRLDDGVLHLDLTMKVFVVRDASWVRTGRDAITLNHEQRHFDIVKLVAERFKQQADPTRLTVADYNSQLQYQFLESWRQMTAMQEQYDRETRHGLDGAAQQRWNQQIDRDLLSLGAKK